MQSDCLTLPAVREALAPYGVRIDAAPGEYLVYLKEHRPELAERVEGLAEAFAAGVALAMDRPPVTPHKPVKRTTRRQVIRAHNRKAAALRRAQAVKAAEDTRRRACALADHPPHQPKRTRP